MKFSFMAAAVACTCLVSASETIRNSAFDEFDAAGKPVAWFVNGKYRIAKGFGHNGSGGLYWSSDKQCGKLHIARQELSGLEPGTLVEISSFVRKENFKCDSHQGAVMSVEWRDEKGKWISALYAITRSVPDSEWTHVVAAGRMPDCARSAVMVIYVSGDSTGTVQWDNVMVKKGTADVVGFVASTTYAATAADGKTRFNAALRIPKAARGSAQAVFSWRDSAGGIRRAPADRLTDELATIELDVKSLAMGRHPVTCELLSKGKVIGAATNVFTRVERMPERRVWIDGHGRCIVNGKPFFPLGLYWNPAKERMGVYTNGPFNCVIHYEMMDKRRLDFCAKHGLMTLNAFDRTLVSCLAEREGNKYTPAAAEDMLTKRIKAVKDHPALLAWYIGDELPATLIPRQRKLYDIAKLADDQHPVYGVQDRWTDLREFTQTMDVIGLDPYPVSSKPLRRVTEFMRKGRAAMFDMRPHWSVPQAFSWQWYNGNAQTTERFPTFSEMRSMVWQHIAGGANGIISFAFHCLFYPTNLQDWRPRWEITRAVHQEVKDMVPVLLSVDPAPSVTVESGDLACRTWVKDGDLYLLACDISGKPGDATVRISSGAWRMLGTELGSPASMADSSVVSFYFDAYGVSFVRLGRCEK